MDQRAPPVGPGDEAPDFELRDQSDRLVRLSDFRGRKAVVLYFYPHDFTPVCTREACGFRDDAERFHEAGAEILGVSPDTVESHTRFAAKHRLPFRLLADPQRSAFHAYGVGELLGILPRRVTFVIDRGGIIRFRRRAQFRGVPHVAESLQALQRLEAPAEDS